MENTRTIQQTAQETGISIDTLRYYERIGLIVDIARAANGHRRYSDTDIVWILFLKQLRATGMPIATMQTFAKLRKQGATTVAERRAMLEDHRRNVEAQIQTLEAFLSVIDGKIDRHRQHEADLESQSKGGEA